MVAHTGVVGTWIRLARPRDWAGSKLPFLAAAAVLLAPASASATQVLAVLLTVVAGSCFGYTLNEVADRESDAGAGKPNRAAGLGPGRWLPPVVLSAVAAVGLTVAWAPDAAAPVLVLLGLVLAAAYSVAPLRLKERRRAGVVGAAAAQWLVPVLVVAALEPGGWHSVSAWALALLGLAIGIRAMAVHQLRDAGADRRSGIRTWLSGRRDAARLLYATFACELVMLTIALVSLWPSSVPVLIALVPFARLRVAARLATLPPGPVGGLRTCPLGRVLLLCRAAGAGGTRGGDGGSR